MSRRRGEGEGLEFDTAVVRCPVGGLDIVMFPETAPTALDNRVRRVIIQICVGDPRLAWGHANRCRAIRKAIYSASVLHRRMLDDVKC